MDVWPRYSLDSCTQQMLGLWSVWRRGEYELRKARARGSLQALGDSKCILGKQFPHGNLSKCFQNWFKCWKTAFCFGVNKFGG